MRNTDKVLIKIHPAGFAVDPPFSKEGIPLYNVVRGKTHFEKGGRRAMRGGGILSKKPQIMSCM